MFFNVNRDPKKSQPAKLSDFLPHYEEKPAPKTTTAQQMQIADMVTKVVGQQNDPVKNG